MRIVQLTPGTGGMYCGNCLRDNALVAELRRQGHEALLVPLYLPLTLDEADESLGTPIFFGGISVYLDQKFRWFRSSPRWLRHLLCSPRLLALAAGRTARTRAEDVGEILISMLRGPEGRQARELDELVGWLKNQPRPDAVCLSNALLLGLAVSLKEQLNAPVVCFLQGEDSYLDDLDPAYREPAWQLLRQKAADADLFIAPNRYFADLMASRLSLPAKKVTVVREGISLEGYGQRPKAEGQRQTPERATLGVERAADREGVSRSLRTTHHPTVGYFARMCPEKGLHVLVEAFIELRRRGQVPEVQLKAGGGCSPGDESFVVNLKARLASAGMAEAASFHPNLDRARKIEFLQSLDVFCVPATGPESFGTYLVEALAAGVPVVQPRLACFPEFVDATGGGVLYEPGDEHGLVEALEELLRNPGTARDLGEAGRRLVLEQFGSVTMAREVAGVIASLG